MLETNRLAASITASSAALVLALTACSTDDSADNGNNNEPIEENSTEESVETVSAEERLEGFWTESQNALDASNLQNFMTMDDVDEINDTLFENEDLTNAVETYVAVPDFSDEELAQYGMDSNEDARYIVSIMPSMMDLTMEMFADSNSSTSEDMNTDGENMEDAEPAPMPSEEDESSTEEDSDGTGENGGNSQRDGVHIISSEEPDNPEEGDTASIEFIPNSTIDAFMGMEDDITEEEAIERVEEEMDPLLIVDFEYIDGEWMVDVEKTVESLETAV